MNPIFIHSLWRSGSTYVWSRFRAIEAAIAYYEPFHEILGVATREELAAQSPDKWPARHPKLDRGYYAEYLPLVLDRGVPGFQKGFTVDHYFADDDALASEQPYLDLLLSHAGREGRVPVLACCRSLGRLPWLKRRYGGTHIVLRREPAQQWCSGHFLRIENGQSYFEVMPFQILGKAKWEPAQRIARLLGVPHHDEHSFFLEHDFYFAQFGNAEFERSYAAFHALLSLSLDRALNAADLVIDIDRLSLDEPYRHEIERRIATATGLTVAFDDCELPRRELPHAATDFSRIAQAVEALLAD
ncbi:MAG TPA: hypothetical protein VKZ79_02070 [Alphaproteobacteria bacterium]|nr:hypothetical protein [Alphaproteobacteria bacterium]